MCGKHPGSCLSLRSWAGNNGTNLYAPNIGIPDCSLVLVSETVGTDQFTSGEASDVESGARKTRLSLMASETHWNLSVLVCEMGE